jgi:hypothetical protein
MQETGAATAARLACLRTLPEAISIMLAGNDELFIDRDSQPDPEFA